MKIKSLSTEEVENIIKSLKLKNSSGYDDISTKILKLSSLFISSTLNYICNKSIAQGIFPDLLKYSEIKPLYKKGDKSQTTKYRPISLLTSFSKVFEKAMNILQLLKHIHENNILAQEQISIDTVIYKLLNEILKTLNIFCDL
jgi:Notch-like protein